MGCRVRDARCFQLFRVHLQGCHIISVMVKPKPHADAIHVVDCVFGHYYTAWQPKALPWSDGAPEYHVACVQIFLNYLRRHLTPDPSVRLLREDRITCARLRQETHNLGEPENRKLPRAFKMKAQARTCTKIQAAILVPLRGAENCRCSVLQQRVQHNTFICAVVLRST